MACSMQLHCQLTQPIDTVRTTHYADGLLSSSCLSPFHPTINGLRSNGEDNVALLVHLLNEPARASQDGEAGARSYTCRTQR